MIKNFWNLIQDDFAAYYEGIKLGRKVAEGQNEIVIPQEFQTSFRSRHGFIKGVQSGMLAYKD